MFCLTSNISNSLALNFPSTIASWIGPRAPGERRLSVDTAKLLDIVDQLRARAVGYALGAKAILLSPISSIADLDCSGLIRYVLFHATYKRVMVPDGTWWQDDWCQKQGFERIDYKSTAGDGDNRLRIAFKHVGPVSHAWLVLNGQTIESHRGVGPDRRDWKTGALYRHVSRCYLLT